MERAKLIEYYKQLATAYPIMIIEDPLHEDDFDGYAELTRQTNLIVAGDDLFVTNANRLLEGIRLGAATGMVFKPNQAGTLSEAVATADIAKEHGICLIASSRVGGSVDDPNPEIAVAIGAPIAKFGAPRTGERTSYHNCLIRIEEELGSCARFAYPHHLRR